MITITPEMELAFGQITDMEFAGGFNVSYSWAVKKRKERGLPAARKWTTITENSMKAAVDSGKYPEKKIASHFKTSLTKINEYKRSKSATGEEVGMPNRTECAMRTIMRDSINWEGCTDIQIANVIKLSRERVRQYRVELGRKSKVFHQKSVNAEFSHWASVNHQQIEGKRLRDIIQMYPGIGIMAHAARTILVALGVKYMRTKGMAMPSKWPWDIVDWKLGNSVLVDIWGCRYFHTKRCYYRKGPSTHIPGTHKHEQAVKEEKIKAEKWLSENPNSALFLMNKQKIS